jgi:hypothetical protein
VASIIGHSGGKAPSVVCLDSCNISDELLGLLSMKLAICKNLTELFLEGLDQISSDAWDRLFVDLEESKVLNQLKAISFYDADRYLFKPLTIDDLVIRRLGKANALQTICLGSCS